MNYNNLLAKFSILLLFIVLFYAIPSIFNNNLYVQISTDQNLDKIINLNISDEIKKIFIKNGLQYSKMYKGNNKIKIYFIDYTSQKKANDLLKSVFDKRFVITCNPFNNISKLSRIIGANPIKLGLDLHGGISFLLEIKIHNTINNYVNSRDIASLLKESQLNIIKIEKNDNLVQILFPDKMNLSIGFAKLSNVFPHCVFKYKVIDNYYILNMIIPEKLLSNIIDNEVHNIIKLLKNRLNVLGINDYIIQRQDIANIKVDIPHIQNVDRIRNMISKMSTIKFKMVDTDHNITQSILTGDIPLGSQIYDYNKTKLLLYDNVILQSNDISHANIENHIGNQVVINVKLFDSNNKNIFNKSNVGKSIAAIYVENDFKQNVSEHITGIFTITSMLDSNNFQITGSMSNKDTQDLITLLRCGNLVTPISILQESVIESYMGSHNIDKMLIVLFMGCIVIVLFMILYYHILGIIFGILILLNLIFTISMVSILELNLTLFGIIGIFLNFITSLETYILIYERIREELRNHCSIKNSIFISYKDIYIINDINIVQVIIIAALFLLKINSFTEFSIFFIISFIISIIINFIYGRVILSFIYDNINDNTKLTSIVGINANINICKRE